MAGPQPPGAVGRGRFTPAQRVRKRSEYKLIQSQARRVSTASFALLIFAREPSKTGARLGIVVSRRIGNAVVRNRVKRLVREAFRATRELWESDVDLVVIARKVPEPATLAGVVAELEGRARAIAARTAEARKDREKRAEQVAPAATKTHTAPR